MDTAEREERGRKFLNEKLGPERAAAVCALWQSSSSDFESYLAEFLFGEIWQRPGLDLRTRSLVTIASLASLGKPLALEFNIRLALKNGATKEDVIETLLQIAPFAGFPACWEALTVANRVFKEGPSRPSPLAGEG